MKLTRNEAGRHCRVINSNRGKLNRAGLALATILCLVSANPVFADSFVETFNKGLLAGRRGDLPAALGYFNEARDLNPKDPQTRKYLAITNQTLHHFNEAETEYLALISLQDTIENQLLLAEFYVLIGKHQNALTVYQTILSREEKNVPALLGAGISSESLGEMADAEGYYEKIIEYYPRSKQADNARARLPRLSKAQKVEGTNQFFPIESGYGEAGLGWWDLHKMPLHVYIDSGDGVPFYRSEMREAVARALTAWSSASNQSITFIIDGIDAVSEGAWKELDDTKPILLRWQEGQRMPRDPVPAQIHIHWTKDLYQALGLTWTSKLQDYNPVLSKAHVWLQTDRLPGGTLIPASTAPEYQEIFDEQIKLLESTAAHELGHVLGLPHLSNPNDVMADGIYGFNAKYVQEEKELTSRDIQALAEHYNNFEGNGYQRPNLQTTSRDESKVDDESKYSKEENEDVQHRFAGVNPLGGLKGSDTPDEKDKEPISLDEKAAADEKKAEDDKKIEEDKIVQDEKKSEEEKKADEKPEEPKPKLTPEEKKAEEEKKEEEKKAEEEKKLEEEKKVEEKAKEDEEKRAEEEKKQAEKAKEEQEKAEEEEWAAAEPTHHKSKSGGPQGYHPLKEAIFYLNAKQYNEALAILNKYLNGHHNDAQALYLRGVVHVMQRDYPLAAADYKEVIRIYPNSDLSRKATDGLKKISF